MKRRDTCFRHRRCGVSARLVVAACAVALTVSSLVGCTSQNPQPPSNEESPTLPNTKSTTQSTDFSTVTPPAGGVGVGVQGLTGIPSYFSLPQGLKATVEVNTAEVAIISLPGSQAQTVLPYLETNASTWGMEIVAQDADALIAQSRDWKISASCDSARCLVAWRKR